MSGCLKPTDVPTSEWPNYAHFYGEIMVSCANCHCTKHGSWTAKAPVNKITIALCGNCENKYDEIAKQKLRELGPGITSGRPLGIIAHL